MDFAVIDNNEPAMRPDSGRGLGFVQALDEWKLGKDYDFIRYDRISEHLEDLRHCRGLILSGSRLDFADPGNRLSQTVYQRMTPEFRLLREFIGPVLAICFGHQLLALAEEFEDNRSDFGQLRIRNMMHPRNDYLIARARMNSPLRFTDRTEIWVQYNHKQQVDMNATLRRYFDVVAGSDHCPVEVIQHRSREWFGVQFHPEIGKESKQGDIGRHDCAVRDGYALIRDFVRYCLNASAR